jgi:epoxyqueuosine reductase QueG
MIKLNGAIPDEFHAAIAESGRTYGCDICRRSARSTGQLQQPRIPR